jgi:hypothetical protein
VAVYGVATLGFTNKDDIQSSDIDFKNHVFHSFWTRDELSLYISWNGDTLETMKKLKKRIARVRPEKKGKILLQHGNTQPHTSILTRETTEEYGWTVLVHLPYSHDPVWSDEGWS